LGRLGWFVIAGLFGLALALPAALLREHSPNADIKSASAKHDLTQPPKLEIDEPSDSIVRLESNKEPARKERAVPAREAFRPAPVPAVPAPAILVTPTAPESAVTAQRLPLVAAEAQAPGVADQHQRLPGAPIQTNSITTVPIDVAPVTVGPVQAAPAVFPGDAAATQPAGGPGDLWAQGKQILARACTNCHSADFVYSGITARRALGTLNTRQDHAALVLRENARGAQLANFEFQPLVDWLTNFAGLR
jgi:hypothetical protein